MQTLAAQFQGILNTFLNDNPQYAADPGGVLEKYVLDTLHTCMAAYAQAQAPVPPVRTTAEIQAAIKAGDHYGLFDEIFATDHNGNATFAMDPVNDPHGNVRATVLGSMLDKVYILRDGLIRDDSHQLAKTLAIDPLGRLPESIEPLALASITELSLMTSTGRLGEVARANGYKLQLPAEYAADVPL